MASRSQDLSAVIIWIGCVFVSILVHEYGHALMSRRFDGSPSIVLYGLGGLCYSQGERTPAERLAVLFAGPGAGFLLCGLVLAIASLTLGISSSEHLAMIKEMFGLGLDPQEIGGAVSKLRSPSALRIYFDMIWINLAWGLVNLLPIWPLDGGQATQVVLSQVDRHHGVRRSHIVSLVTAGVAAVVGGTTSRDPLFMAVFFGMLAFLNFQVLQSLHHAHSFSDYDDADWWKR
jgi:membrane-associated protease RseP (regulator of RpoE activity)